MSGLLTPTEIISLQRLYWGELTGGLPDATQALRHLAQGTQVEVAWTALRRFFHRVAGPSASVGFPLLGRLGSVGEGLCDVLAAGELARNPAAQRVLGELLAGLEEALKGRAELTLTEEPVPQLTRGGSAGKIIVVDDDPVSAAVILGPLRAAGFEATCIEDPQKATEILLAERPDLLILDVLMPGLDGFELCARIRQTAGLQLLPILFVTRRDDVAQRVRGLEVGGNDYIGKPFEPVELVARVRSHLNRLAALQEMAIRDGLTRCYNQKYFKSRLEQELARARRYQLNLAVALLDVDLFKQINDKHGHIAGDAVLAGLASVISASLRSTDVVARYGGEEFGILLIQAGASEAQLILNRMRQRIEGYRFASGQASDAPLLSCTVSLGIAELRDTDTPQSLLDRSDRALYSAKDHGRNRVEIGT